MTDREKVIKGMECCFADMDWSDSTPCHSCPYGTLPKDMNCQKKMFAHVLALLKEQEAVKIKVKKINDSGRCGRCPNCLMELNEMDYPNYCGYCGQSVKWE